MRGRGERRTERRKEGTIYRAPTRDARYASRPAGCQSTGKEGGLKQGLHGKVKTRTLKDEGCGTQLEGEEKLRVVTGGVPEVDGGGFGGGEAGRRGRWGRFCGAGWFRDR